LGRALRRLPRSNRGRGSLAPHRAIGLRIAGVSAGTGFGKAVGLRISGKIFAFPKDGELILKLPSSRVAELIESGAGRPWGPGAKVMKEWVAVSATASDLWAPLAAEAHTFVGSS
jgi:hypothetical protein